MAQILVIDDDPTMRLVLKRNLAAQGHEVALASDGETGWAMAQTLRPALVISDWMMPGLDGLGVCARIRSSPALATTFFVLLTSRDQLQDRVRGLDSGADDFLVKPIDPSELQARVRAGLRLQQLNQDLHQQKQRLEQELSEAAVYVRSLLPPPIAAPVATDWVFVPSTELGGDCFDYFALDNDHFAIYLLDVSGHGVGSALLSVSVLNLLRSRSLPHTDFTQPRAVLEALNQAFPMENHGDKYFTIWYGVYHLQRHELTYVSGGHPPALLRTQQGLTALPGTGLAVGMFAGVTYNQQVLRVPPNSSLYVFSDGAYEVPEAPGQDAIWGLDAFTQVLETGEGVPTPQSICERIPRRPGQGWPDDLSILRVDFP